MTRMNRASAVFVAATLSAGAWAYGQTLIGAAGAVAGLVKAVSKGEAAVGHVIESGKQIFLHDHVTTDAKGRLQVMLIDETVFTLGPNSDMVLDEFVYDPATGAGKVTAQVTKGVFRFVTGKVAQREPSNMKVKLPAGLIGIRGTIAGGKVDGGDSLVVLFGPGAQNNAEEKPGMVQVENAGASVDLVQPGYGTRVTGDNPPSPPFQVPAAQLNELLSAMAPKAESSPQPGGGGGGASEDSGQGTAEGKAGASDTELSASEQNAINTLQNQATADAAQHGGILDGISTWEQVRSIESGSGFYSGSGVFTLSSDSSGGPCTGTCTGSSSMSLDIDFGARTVGGGGSTLDVSVPAQSFSANSPILSTNFASLSGNAVISCPPACSNTNFNGTDITLMNKNGVPAKEAQADINHAAGSFYIGTGSVVGTR